MEAWLQSSISGLLAALALPGIGLPAIFLVSAISATLLPLGSEPAVFAYVKLAPAMFWPAVLVATVGNTMGGAISYGLGRGAWDAWRAWRARRAADRRHPVEPEAVEAAPPPAGADDGGARGQSRWHRYAAAGLDRFGPRAMLFTWLPGIGDPLCALAGWRRFPFWPSMAYMAIGKFARYVAMTAGLLWVFPS
jgi:membrane protein YqaA with SNARE-associated domain